MKVVQPQIIRRAVGFADLIEPVAKVVADFSKGLGEAPISVFTPRGGDVQVKSAWLADWPLFTVKVASSFPSGTDGFIAVLDAVTGEPRLILRDEHHLTDIRTAAAGAVATRALARADAATLAVIGTGAQAYLQALAISGVRPIERVLVWGRRPEAAARVVRALADRGLTAETAASAESAVRQADVLVTATASREPIVEGAWLAPGTHITAVGADDPSKAELDAACFARADVIVVDSREATPRLAGDLRAARTPVDAELGEVLLGRHPGRRSQAEITVAKLIGLGVQDLAAAHIALDLLGSTPGDRPASGLDLL